MYYGRPNSPQRFSMKLLIRNLPRTTTEAELRELFEKQGKVQSCMLVMDKESGESKGFGFIEMPKSGEAKASIKNLNGKEIAGNKLRVKKAEPKSNSTDNKPKTIDTTDAPKVSTKFKWPQHSASHSENPETISETGKAEPLAKIIFEELDYQETPLGNISLRRRTEPRLNGKLLYEVKLGDEFLMSSLFTESEIQLAKLALAALKETLGNKEFDIVVGGLGLGYTAFAVLEDPAVRSLKVIEVMQPVINWHQQGLVPLGEKLMTDSRCHIFHADFFAEATTTHSGFDQQYPDKQVHAVLLDIDHSPTHWLNEDNSSFYTEQSLNKLANKILPGGIFGLWSNDPVDKNFIELLNKVFESTESHVVSFPNPYTDGKSSCTVYLSRKKN